MLDAQRVQHLVDEISAITDQMTAITQEQREGILANGNDQIARMDAVLTGIVETQTQLVGLVRALASTVIEHLLN